MSAAQELLKAFAADRGLPGLEPDSDGQAGLKVEGKVAIDLKASGDRLYVYGSLGPVPAVNEQAVLEVLLRSNLAGGAGEGPVLSIDPALGDIVVSQEIDARSASSATVLRAVGAIAEQVEAWVGHLAKIDERLRERRDEIPAERMAWLMNRA